MKHPTVHTFRKSVHTSYGQYKWCKYCSNGSLKAFLLSFYNFLKMEKIELFNYVKEVTKKQ